MTTAVAERDSSTLAGLPFPADRFEVSHGVAILDEHERPEGYLGRDKLQAIADRLNERIDDSGDYTPIIVRHTPDDDSQPQPPVVGYAGPFEVKKFGNRNPRWAIFARDWFIEKAEKNVASKHPRRSVELAIDRRTKEPSHINSIALLGAEAPRRMLGLKLSDKDGHEVERYMMPTGGDGKSPAGGKMKGEHGQQGQQQSPFSALAGDDALVAKMLAALEQTDVFVWARQQMAVKATQDSQNPDDESGDDNGQGEFAGADDQIDETDEAGGGNPALAGKQENRKMSDKKPDAGKEPADKMQATAEVEKYKAEVSELRGQVDKLSAKNEELSTVVAALQKDKIKAARVDKLRDLADGGLAFDLDDAKTEVDKMESDAEFERYVGTLKKHCTQIPIGHKLPDAAVDKLRMKDEEKAKAIVDRTNEIVEEMVAKGDKRPGLDRYRAAKSQAEKEFAAAQ